MFPYIACIQPNGFVRIFFPDFLHQLTHIPLIGRMEGIPSGKGDAGNIWLIQLLENFLSGRLVKGQASFRIPGYGILAFPAAMLAA